MWKRSPSLGVLTLFMSLGLSSWAQAEPLKVVSSFSILADMVQQVGGDKVQSFSIIGPESDAHAFEPRPSDAKVLQQADLLIINGADFEAWLPKLVASSGYKGPVVESTAGLALLSYQAMDHDEHGRHEEHDHGDHDPHAWQSLVNAQHYVQRIQDALITVDAENSAYYTQRAAAYTQQMQVLHDRLVTQFQALPATQRTVVSTHDAFAYLGQSYGLEFLALLGASTQAEPSAKELAELVKYMRAHQVDAVFMEKGTSPRLVEQIARETAAKIGRPLYPDSLAKAPHAADSYLGMMQWNAEAVLEALTAP